MRLIIEFENDYDIFLPKNHNAILQGFIYRNLSEKIAEKMHDKGFAYENRVLKLFTFSRLLSKHVKPIKDGFLFESPAKFIVSSIYHPMIMDLYENLEKKKTVVLGTNIDLKITNMKITDKKNFSDEILIKFYSPLTVYSTAKFGGKNKTYYYKPMERDFSRMVFENGIKKYRMVTGRDFSGKELRLLPKYVNSKKNMTLTKYKNFVIEAWDGIYRLIGDPLMIKILYDTGIGAKNSQGFGLWEPYSKGEV